MTRSISGHLALEIPDRAFRSALPRRNSEPSFAFKPSPSSDRLVCVLSSLVACLSPLCPDCRACMTQLSVNTPSHWLACLRLPPHLRARRPCWEMRRGRLERFSMLDDGSRARTTHMNLAPPRLGPGVKGGGVGQRRRAPARAPVEMAQPSLGTARIVTQLLAGR